MKEIVEPFKDNRTIRVFIERNGRCGFEIREPDPRKLQQRRPKPVVRESSYCSSPQDALRVLNDMRHIEHYRKAAHLLKKLLQVAAA